MFNSKKSQLFTVNNKPTSAFVQAGMKKSAETRSENGALKYSTTGDAFADQFSKLGSYKAPRSFDDISADCELLWSINRLLCVLFIFYIRTITRVVTLFSGISTTVSQKGAELKHEGIMRMLWLHFKAPDTFWKNITLFVSVGSWKDIFVMLSYDLVHHGWEGKKLNWQNFGNLILTGLETETQTNLVKKYLPQIKSNSNCKTVGAQSDNLIAKWICSLLFGNRGEQSGWTYKKYRKLKTSGTAHEWQQLISQQKFARIDFSKIHGRALSILVKSKFLKNQGLSEKYNDWVAKPETNVKYTGFVHELFSGNFMRDNATIETTNKQFATLVEKGGAKNATNFIVVRDTSGSMGSTATGTNMTCFNIAKALALYFSEFLTGSFANAWIEFNSKAKMHQWIGNTPVEKWRNDKSGFVGSTNFLSVIQLFVTLKKQGVSESEFPTGILCISDSEFNPGQLGKTNVESAKSTLLQGGFSREYVDNFIIVLWNLQRNSGGNKFETYGDVKNVFYFSGYSAATISFLTGEIETPSQLFESAMNQEVLQMIEL